MWEFLQLGQPMLLVVSLADNVFDKLPKAWFFYLFTGIGAVILLIACCGCIGVATRIGRCLTCFRKIIKFHAGDLVDIELGLAAFIFFDKSWKELVMQKIENSTVRQGTYTKRRDGIVKKVKELSILCDTDVALIMFSPIGRVTSFSSHGRVEDIFLRFMDRPDELRGGPINNEKFLSRRLKQLKYEGAMLEKITVIEDLEEKLDKLNQRKREVQEKMRYYEPNLEKISSVLEVGVYQQFLASALHRTQFLKAQMLVNQIAHQNTEGTIIVHDTTSVNDHCTNWKRNRMKPMRNGDQS